MSLVTRRRAFSLFRVSREGERSYFLLYHDLNALCRDARGALCSRARSKVSLCSTWGKRETEDGETSDRGVKIRGGLYGRQMPVIGRQRRLLLASSSASVR